MCNEMTSHADSNKCYIQGIGDSSIFEVVHIE